MSLKFIKFLCNSRIAGIGETPQGFVEVDCITESTTDLANSMNMGPQQVLKGKDEDVPFNIPNLVTVETGGAQGLGEGIMDKTGMHSVSFCQTKYWLRRAPTLNQCILLWS